MTRPDDRAADRLAAGGLLKLHLGAFDCGIAGWHNTDITTHLWIARVPGVAWLLHKAGAMPARRYRQHREGVFRRLHHVNLTKPLPFGEASCAAVFSSHVLEHLYLDEAKRLIRDIHRVLAPGGVCRLVVPDLEKILALYDARDVEPFVQAMFEAKTRGEAKLAHHAAFTRDYLVRQFQDAGFRDAYAADYRQGRCPDIAVLDNRPEESLYVEAVK